MTHGGGLLGYILLGLLHQKPSSGYDLRKVFTQTPMGNFSDSPGAIYPALRRLDENGLIDGKVEVGSGLRKRKVFRVTPRGRSELKTWLTKPITRIDVSSAIGESIVRFSFLEGVAGEAATIQFLRAFEAELRPYLRGLTRYFHSHGPDMPRSGRLALQNGVLGYEAQLRWARQAMAAYQIEQ